MNISPADRTKLLECARGVLDTNWTGRFTKPAQRQYPHQWSWDSAFIAMGYARYDQGRAEQELRSLFSAQWPDGRVPHIVFHDANRAASYFPGPDFWQIERSPAHQLPPSRDHSAGRPPGTSRAAATGQGGSPAHQLPPSRDHSAGRPPGTSCAAAAGQGGSPNAPSGHRTTGIVQPPIHATAVLHIYRCAADQERALAYVAEMFPRLCAWHDFLYRERDRHAEGLVYICHPWESGQDNSPLWDPVLARMALQPEQIPPYRRADTRAVDPAERPLDSDYDCYIFLVDFFRQRAYDEWRIYADGCPFLVQDVLFNTLLCRAEQDMAELARLVGADPVPHLARAEVTAASMNAKLWDESRGLYVDYDLAAGMAIAVPALAGFAPLFGGIPDGGRAKRMLDYLGSPAFGLTLPAGGAGFPASSYDRTAPGYSPRRYWRGPVWIQMNWLMMHGLADYGYLAHAERLRQAIVQLPFVGGFREYFDPETGAGYGAETFSWTAALLIDALHDDYPDE